jgi:hypothetical protein
MKGRGSLRIAEYQFGWAQKNISANPIRTPVWTAAAFALFGL